MLNKRFITHQIFNNGQLLLDNINNLNCLKCKKIFIITDFNMPYIDGVNLAMKLRENKKHEFIIVLVTAEHFDDINKLFD